MLKLLKGVLFASGCILMTGVVAMVMAGNDLKAGIGAVLFVGAVVTLSVFLRTVFGADSGRSKRRSKSNVWLNPGAEEWGAGSSGFTNPHGW